MNDYEPDAEERTDIDERDVRALQQYLTVLDVEFATGKRPIPDGVDDVDPQLGEHVSTGPRAVATDGGQVLETRLPFEVCVSLPASTVHEIDAQLEGSRAGTVEEWLEEQVHAATGDGVTDVAGDAKYTAHVEPEEQGGEVYLRCTHCKRELLANLGIGRLTHAKNCPNADDEAGR